MTAAELRAASARLAESANPETIRNQQAEIRALRAENVELRRVQARMVSLAALFSAIMTWMLRDGDSLVVDIDGEPVTTVHALVERWYTDYDLLALDKLSRYVSAAATAGLYPRTLCQCGEPECMGCDGDHSEIIIPVEVRALIAEARRV